MRGPDEQATGQEALLDERGELTALAKSAMHGPFPAGAKPESVAAWLKGIKLGADSSIQAIRMVLKFQAPTRQAEEIERQKAEAARLEAEKQEQKRLEEEAEEERKRLEAQAEKEKAEAKQPEPAPAIVPAEPPQLTQDASGSETEVKSEAEQKAKPDAKGEKPKAPSIEDLGKVCSLPIPILEEIRKAIAANPNGKEAQDYQQAKTKLGRLSRDQKFEEYKQRVCRMNEGSKSYYIETKTGSWISVDATEIREQLDYEGAFDWIRDLEPDYKKHRAVKDAFVSDLRSYARSENSVVWVGKQAGYRKGVRVIDGEKHLFTKGPKIIEPREGDCSKIRNLLGQMFREQLPSVECWLKWGYDGLINEKGGKQPGQGLFIVGDPGDGKTFITHEIIIPILGGRHADPMAMVRGNSQFNSLEGESEVLLIDDDPRSYNNQQRTQFAGITKRVTAAQSHRLESKYQNAITANPFWRLVVLANHDAISALPTIEDSVKGKVMFLNTYRRSESFTPEEIREQLPAYVYYLQNMEIPAELKNEDRRYGVISIHHDDVVKSLEDLSDESNMLRMIDSLIFNTTEKTDEWSGGSYELRECLLGTARTVGQDQEVKALLPRQDLAGRYLAKLVGPRSDHRISRRKTEKRNIWVIKPPMPEQSELEV